LIQEVILAAAIHTPNPASANETEAISDSDQPVQPTSTEDEDPNEEVVTAVCKIDGTALPRFFCFKEQICSKQLKLFRIHVTIRTVAGINRCNRLQDTFYANKSVCST
jgi:hypothetical protein